MSDSLAPLRVEVVLDVVLATAGRLLQGEGSSLMLLVAPEELEVVRSPTNPAALGARVRFGEGVAGKVAASLDGALVSGRAGRRSKPVDSGMSVPLVHDGRIFGVLNVNAAPGRTFTEHDLIAATAFAGHAADALAAARLYELERQATVASRRLDEMLEHLGLAASVDFVEPRAPALVNAAKVARDIATAATDAGKPTHVRGPATVPVQADARHLGRALAELVDNGHIHGEPPVRIIFEVDDNEATATVADSGRGIAAKARDAIFEPFGRLDNAADAPGLGIGLTIARRLVESFGGRIEASETPVGGAAFRVHLRSA